MTVSGCENTPWYSLLLMERTLARLTRAELTAEVHQVIGLPLKEADIVVCTILDSIVRADDDVRLLQGQPNDLVNLLGQFGSRQPRQSPFHQQQRIPRSIFTPRNSHGVAFGTRGSASLLQADLIVDGLPQPLLAAQVSLRSLHRNVAQEELNLLQFAARRMA